MRRGLKQGGYAVVVIALLVGIFSPAVYLSRRLDARLAEQSTALGYAIQNALGDLRARAEVTRSAPSGGTMLDEVAKAAVKIELRLKYEVVRVRYREEDRPTLDELAQGKMWLIDRVESRSIRWLRYLCSGITIYSGENRAPEWQDDQRPVTYVLTNYHCVEQLKYLGDWQFVLAQDAEGNYTFDVIEGWRLFDYSLWGYFGGDTSFGVPLKVYGGSLYREDALANPTLDVAILQPVANIGGLPAVQKWADPKGLALGQRIFAVGFPLGLPGPAVTSGVISVVRQDFGGSAEGWNYDWVWNNLLQYDAETAPGSSGSVLVNEAGEIVGIVRGSEVDVIRILGPRPQNPLWYDPITGRPLPPLLPPWLRTHDKPTKDLEWQEVHIPIPGIHYGIRGEAIMKWLRMIGLGFVLE